MPASLVLQLVEKIRKRKLKDGGFLDQEDGFYRPDATSWAVLACKAAGAFPQDVDSALSRLVTSQMKDGRIPVSPAHPESFWPTPLAIMAWQGSDNYRQNIAVASQFLLNTTGCHPKKEQDSPAKHDPSLRGWPWVEKTHSWIEPTVLSILALDLTGNKNHERVKEAVKMILDRQLPKGGWNYGNTVVFNNELQPLPDTTGMSLNVLAGRVPADQINRSLDYLNKRIKNVRTPISLAWAVLGLGAWGKRPSDSQDMILESMKRERKFGSYSTTAYSLLVLASLASRGIESVIAYSDPL